jgi:alpha-ketoglutarate-dependent taurine dioxygenase
MATMKTLETQRLTETVGAEVLDLDCERLLSDGAVPGAFMDALEEYGVLVLRGLRIDDETQTAFCRKLGEIVLYPDQRVPEIFVVSLDPAKNPMAGYLHATVYWHMDDTPKAIPSKATMLSAKVLSAEGGETEFASTYAAYELLSVEERERFASLRVVHSQVGIQSLVYRDPTPEQLEEWRGRAREHPLVWTHGAGRRSLVIGQTTDYVVGVEARDSRALLDDLLARATAPELVYRHAWSEGDTIMWDNRGVLHRVMPYPASSNREMHRTTLEGDEPIQ